MTTQTILIAFGLTMIAGLSTGLGSILAFFTKRSNHKALSGALGLSAGVMVYISFMEMMPQSLHLLSLQNSEQQAMVYMLLAFFGGIALIWGIDLLIPVPLSPGRRRWRGYNQAERIAFGLSQVTGIPLSTEHLFRLRDNPSQTALDSRARLESMRSLFSLKHPETLAGKHVLLIDDVFTTGATLQACVGALSGCPDIHFSLLTLACTAS